MRAGDIVVLKSGGPLMTVNGFDDHGRVEVTWFSSWPPAHWVHTPCRVETAWFSPSALEPVNAGTLRPVDVEQQSPAPGRHLNLCIRDVEDAP